MKQLIWILLVGGWLLDPVPTPAQTLSLNGAWAFRTDPNDRGEAQGWHRREASTVNWDTLPVPGNWDLHNAYAHYVGKGWYRRTFATPASLGTKAVRLVFEAVSTDCTVWLNGQKLGENRSGFLPFEFDVTGRFNTAGPNTLVVCADNAFSRGAIWNWGGIRRPVTLVVSQPLRIVRQHITPAVDLTTKTATVAVRVFVQNHAAQPVEATGTVVLSANLSLAIKGVNRSLPFRVNVPANGTASGLVQTTLTSAETHLWHFDDPFLYTARTQLANGEGVSNRFGLRKIEVDNQLHTLRLNGEPIRAMGYNLVPDDRTTGNTLPTWRIKEDIDLLKNAGCVLTRLSHLPLPEELMEYLDERGMLVVSEIPLWGFDQLADPASNTPRDWLNRLITQQYNHPSVIGWSVGNEIGDYPTVMAYVQQAIAHARTLDSTRLVTSVSHTAQNPRDIVDLGDLGLINKYGKNLRPITQKQHALHPAQTLFYSEYGIGQLSENLDADVDAKALIDSLRQLPYLIGGSLWTFNDYRSRYVGTKEVSENRPWGVIDVYRHKKRAYESVRREYSPLQSLHVKAPSGTSSAVVRLEPRGPLDLPAYPLHQYRLLWKRTRPTGIIVQGGLLPLPDIRPGDAPLTRALSWQPDEAVALTVELLTPTGDVVADTTLFTQPPPPVPIVHAVGGRTEMNGVWQGGQARIQFQKQPTATAYKARWGETGLTNETPVTLNDYLDIPTLTLGKTYQVAVVGVNNAGESVPAEVRRVRVDTLAVTPPAIQHVEATDDGFYVGYASVADDYLYRVQVTTTPGRYDNRYAGAARTVQTNNPGGLRVTGLPMGRPHYFRVQRVKDNWWTSDWSEERSVTPDGGQRPPVPTVLGVVRQGSEAVLCFDPLPKATGYLLEYRPGGSGTWQRQSVPTAQVGRALLNNLRPNQPYQYRLATVNAHGQSDFSTLITEQAHAQSRRNR